MESLESKKVCGRADCSGGAFVLPVHGCNVVVAVVNRFFANVRMLGQNVVLGDRSRKLKVTVADIAVRVLERNKAVTNPLQERLSP